MAARTRIDLLLVEQGLVASRDRAQRLILAGQVLVDDKVVDKAGTKVPNGAEIRLKVPDHPFVSRGGLKLQGALEDLKLDVRTMRCLDVGSSTGGFTDCLLQRGAAHVVAVDVGTNQLAWRLRQDDRVTLHEKTDARSINSELLDGHIELCVMDASFISARLLLPTLRAVLPPETPLLLLVKPQFEVGKEHIGKGGLVSDPQRIKAAVDAVSSCAAALGFKEKARVPSRVHGARAGNTEVFLLVTGHNEC
jgi:23S rRNA (cytidine1920-2'-O)/16S rRNA (cytidine1409-2'-O)-methyltransferase